MSDFLQVTTTLDKSDTAEELARKLVEGGLAACVQVSGPVTSVYRWQGKMETAAEWVCTIKTRANLYPQLESAINSLHPYDEPEILAVPIERGSDSYLSWVEAETQQS